MIQEAKKKYNTAVGLRLIIKDLIQLRIPIVGHNCFFDLLFMTKAVLRPLPDKFCNFKELLHSNFPTIFDTKYLSNSGCLKFVVNDTALNELYRYHLDPVSNNVNSSGDPDLISKSKINVEVSESEDKFHNAGFDAYCTGYVFAQQLNWLKMQFGYESIQQTIQRISSTMSNKLFMMQSIYHIDIEPLHPDGIIKTKGNLVYIANFPLNTTNDDIIKLFEKVSIQKTSLDLIWIDGSSLIVDVDVGSDIEQLLESLKPNDGWLVDGYWKFKNRRVVANVEHPIVQVTRSMWNLVFGDSKRANSSTITDSPSKKSRI